MSGHPDSSVLCALVDGELSREQRIAVNEHLAVCAACSAEALSSATLKLATAQAGMRYAASSQFVERILRQTGTPSVRPRASWRAVFGWAVAAMLLVTSLTYVALERSTRQKAVAALTKSALATELVDQHIAAMAADAPLQVASSDKHTVKPWFQGKLPFSFNLPENLPAGTTLDGANLTYLGNQPAAQLLYRVHRHRVSVFVVLKSGAAKPTEYTAEQSGFHVRVFAANNLEVLAVSDVGAGDLNALIGAFQQAQAGE